MPKKLTPDQREQVCAMRERGLSLGQIARHFNMSAGAIGWVCLEHGAMHPRTKPRLVPPLLEREPIAPTGGRTVLRYTVAEDELILRMRASGATVSAIARALNPRRGHSSVMGRLLTLARHQEMADA